MWTQEGRGPEEWRYLREIDHLENLGIDGENFNMDLRQVAWG
jgi:hypothetical protein